MHSLTDPDTAPAGMEWLETSEGERFLRRVSHVFPLTGDSSIRLAVSKSLKHHRPAVDADRLLSDVVARLRITRG